MPHTKSAAKRNRQSIVARARNRAHQSLIRTKGLAFRKAAAGGDAKAAQAAYSAFCSVLDKAAKVGSVKKNTAVRRKGRAADLLRKMAAAPAAPAAG
jgi:small subunit ribosomal protein S20